MCFNLVVGRWRPGFQLVSAHSGTVGSEKSVGLLSSPPKTCNGEGKPIGDIHRPLHQDKRVLGMMHSSFDGVEQLLSIDPLTKLHSQLTTTASKENVKLLPFLD